MRSVEGRLILYGGAVGIWLVLLAIAGCGGSSAIQVAPQFGKELSADGVSSDWNALSAKYLQDEEAVVGVANDREYLYVMLRFRDPIYAAAIQGSGLTLWLDGTGGDQREYVLRYRGGPRPEDPALPEAVRAERRRLMTAEMQADSLGRERLTIAIKGKIVEKPIPPGGEEGPLVASGMDQGFYVYEIRIPIGESRIRYYALEAAPGSVVGVGLAWGGRPRPSMMSEMTRGRLMGDDVLPPDEEIGHGGPPSGEPGALRMREREVKLRVTLAGE